MKKKRRKFTPEYKAQLVRIVRETGKSAWAVASEHDVPSKSLSTWVERAKADDGVGRPETLTSVEREELQRLRREIRQLEVERDILKKATAFFAKETT
jgi:transposase